MSKTYSNATELVGRTPLIRTNRFTDGADATIFAKLEFYNPMSSVEDRIAVAIVDTAVAADEPPEGRTIVEGASGNTGIDFAWVGAARGCKVILTTPFSMSKERHMLPRASGAELVLAEPVLRMRRAVDKTKEIVASTDGAILASRFANEANPAIHKKTTGEEIWEDTDGKVDYLVLGIGTRDTTAGAGRVLRRHNPQIKLIAVGPAESPLLSGEKAGPHKIQGSGANFVPNVLGTDLYDEVAAVSSDGVITQARRVATDEGPPVGISPGTALAAAVEIAKQLEVASKMIVVIIPDFGERYVPTAFFEGLVG